jgi:hypothetical protein
MSLIVARFRISEVYLQRHTGTQTEPLYATGGEKPVVVITG